MTQVNIHEAKTHLSKLIEMVLKGEEVIIAKGNKPVAKLVLINTLKPKRKIGSAKDQISIADPIESLPFYHRDPFDRLIIAQSMVRNYPILSADIEFDAYPIKRIW